MKLNKVKQTYLIGSFVIVVLTLLCWLFLVSPRMAQAAEIGDQQTQVQDQNAKSEAQIVKLTAMKDGLVTERQIASALEVKFPPTADQPTLFRQIVAAALAAGIPEKNITSLGPAAPVLGSASAGAKLPGASATPGATGGKGVAVGADNLATMSISFNATGNFDQMVAMLKNLENLPRSFLITQVNLSSGDKGNFTITVQGNMYVYRAVPDPYAASATPATPATPTPRKP
ncbi:type 4a pilus biogenesis protein PilO [Tessaracoccus sp.]